MGESLSFPGYDPLRTNKNQTIIKRKREIGLQEQVETLFIGCDDCRIMTQQGKEPMGKKAFVSRRNCFTCYLLKRKNAREQCTQGQVLARAN
jgi:hypothetical protein